MRGRHRAGPKGATPRKAGAPRRETSAAGAEVAPESAPRAAGPERTCVGCRQQCPRDALVRVVASPTGAVALDPRARGGARGAWVHPTKACVAAMVKRHAAERSLKVPVDPTVDAAALLGDLREAVRRRVTSLVIAASRAKQAAHGAEAVAAALSRGPVGAVLVAGDAGESARSLVEDFSGGPAPRVLRYADKAELGRWFGRAELSLCAVIDPGIAAELSAAVDRLAGLEER